LDCGVEDERLLDCGHLFQYACPGKSMDAFILYCEQINKCHVAIRRKLRALNRLHGALKKSFEFSIVVTASKARAGTRHRPVRRLQRRHWRAATSSLSNAISTRLFASNCPKSFIPFVRIYSWFPV
jgi:hypothetical protein